MNGHVSKLLKRFCLHYGKSYKMYKDNFKHLPKPVKIEVLSMIMKSLPVEN